MENIWQILLCFLYIDLTLPSPAQSFPHVPRPEKQKRGRQRGRNILRDGMINKLNVSKNDIVTKDSKREDNWGEIRGMERDGRSESGSELYRGRNHRENLCGQSIHHPYVTAMGRDCWPHQQMCSLLAGLGWPGLGREDLEFTWIFPSKFLNGHLASMLITLIIEWSSC